MKTAKRLPVVGSIVLLASCASAPPASEVVSPPPGGATIVALEQRFAGASRARGARAAFLEFLADEAIVLQPGPVWGRAAWETSGELPGVLDWSPDIAELSAAGDLGFSTGPWLLTPQEPGNVVEGRYLSVWKRLPAGWRVVFDGGFGRRPGDKVLVLGSTPQLDQAQCQPGPAILAGELQLKDLSLSGSAAGAGYAERVLSRAANGFAAFLPPDVEGARDVAAQRAALSVLPSTTQLWPMGAGIAGSGDIGFTYGLSAPTKDGPADSSYVHVWCRETDGWRLLVELRSSLPPA